MICELNWQDDFNLGVSSIDMEHKRLFKIIDKLLRFSVDEKRSQWAFQEGLKFFRDYSIKHFVNEELYMESVGYADLGAHKRLHDNFRNRLLPAIERELETSQYSEAAIEYFLNICVKWLIDHTLTDDRAIVMNEPCKWTHILPSEDLDALGSAVAQLVYKMFLIKSHMVSDTYTGEPLKNSMYYRLQYGSPSGQTWEVVVTFEQRFLMNTVGKMLDLETARLDEKLLNTLTQQFVYGIRDFLGDLDFQQVLKSNLLTYDEFQSMLQRHQPQARLLFDTGVGYFAICINAPYLTQHGLSMRPQIHSLPVVTSVEKQRTLLIVDDSLTIRESMRRLLADVYDVMTADSGMAAIRTIISKKPDLVLLDYEMPICDGRQVLEMIRSDSSLGELPVFFLTGRADPESVRKVIPLKPEGYLSKNLKPEEIRSYVDRFFQKR